MSEKIAKLAPSSIPMEPSGGIPELTPEDVAGAAQWLSRPRWLACLVKYARDDSHKAELSWLLVNSFFKMAIDEKWPCTEEDWNPPDGSPREYFFQRLAFLAIDEVMDARRGFNPHRHGFDVKKFGKIRKIYDAIYKECDFWANDGAAHIVKRLKM